MLADDAGVSKATSLSLLYPSDHGFDTGTYKIITCTEHELILDADGYIEKSQRYSADCQKET